MTTLCCTVCNTCSGHSAKISANSDGGIKLTPFYFLPEPPHPHKPLTKPVSPAPPFFPPAAASILSSNEGNSTKLNARSKNKGLHGMGCISGGSLYTLGVRDTSDESSLYSPSRSYSGCMKTTFHVHNFKMK